MGVVGNERRRGATAPRVVEECLAARDGDEQVARDDPARVDLDARDDVRGPLEAAGREIPHLGERQRNHPIASFAASRSSNG